MSLWNWKEKKVFFYPNKIHRNLIIPRKIIKEFFPCAFVETAFESEVRFSVFKASILGLQPRDKAAMLGVNTIELFLEEFTWK